MPRVHNLDIYPCNGKPSCIGCVNQVLREADPQDAPAAPAGRPSPAEERYFTQRSPTAAPPPPLEPPRALLNARWSTARVPSGTPVTVTAQADGFPDGTPALIEIRTETGVADRFDTTISGAAISERWLPPGPGLYTFRVEAEGKGAESATLDVRSWIEVSFSLADRPRDAVTWHAVLADGSILEGETPRTGTLRLDDIPAGEVHLTVVAAQARGDAATSKPGAPTPPEDAPHVGVGETIELEHASVHAIIVDVGLVLGFWMRRSEFEGSGAEVAITAPDGAELARRSVFEDSVPVGEAFSLAFPEVSPDATIVAHLEWPDGERSLLYTAQAARDLDVRTAQGYVDDSASERPDGRAA